MRIALFCFGLLALYVASAIASAPDAVPNEANGVGSLVEVNESFCFDVLERRACKWYPELFFEAKEERSFDGVSESHFWLSVFQSGNRSRNVINRSFSEAAGLLKGLLKKTREASEPEWLCADFTQYLGKLLYENGFEFYYVVKRPNVDGENGHAFVFVKVGDHLMPIEPQEQDVFYLSKLRFQSPSVYAQSYAGKLVLVAPSVLFLDGTRNGNGFMEMKVLSQYLELGYCGEGSIGAPILIFLRDFAEPIVRQCVGGEKAKDMRASEFVEVNSETHELTSSLYGGG